MSSSNKENKLVVLSDEKKAKIKKLAREYINKGPHWRPVVHVHGIDIILARAEIHCFLHTHPHLLHLHIRIATAFFLLRARAWCC